MDLKKPRTSSSTSSKFPVCVCLMPTKKTILQPLIYGDERIRFQVCHVSDRKGNIRALRYSSRNRPLKLSI